MTDDELSRALAPLRDARPRPGAVDDAIAVVASDAARQRDVLARLPLGEVLGVAATVVVLALALLTTGGGAGAPAPLPRVPAADAHPLLQRAAHTSAARPALPAPRDDQYVYASELLRETRVDGRGTPQEFVDESWRSVGANRPTRTSERGRSWISAPSDGGWPPARYADLARLPTDPAELRRAVTDRMGSRNGSPREQRQSEVFALLMLLRGWRVMPPGLRTAIYSALAEIPGVRVREDVADAVGRPGIGISAPPGPLRYAYEVIVDRRTYEYLGMRGRLVRNDGVEVHQVIALVDAGVVDELGERPPPGPLTVRDGAP